MAALTGISSTEIFRLTMDSLTSALGGFLLNPAKSAMLVQRENLQSSPKTNANPVTYPQDTLVGRYSAGVDQEFYGHIIVSPYSLDLGLVLSAKLFTLGVWNLTGFNQRLLSWTLQGLDGLTLTDPVGTPVDYMPGAYREYSVTVGTQGQAQLNGSITFNFQGIATGTGTALTGSRLIVFSFEPNWREAPIEHLEWLTDVLTSHNGKEQRLALRQSPRRSMQYLLTLESQNKVNLLEGQMWGWQHRVYCVPIWMDWRPLGVALPIGSTSIAFDPRLRDFAASSLLMFWRDYVTWEIVDVDSLTASTITFRKPTNLAWGPNDRIVPVRLGRMNKRVSVQRPTSTLAEAHINFSFEVPQLCTTRLGVSTWPQFGGLDILSAAPNVNDEEMEESYERDIASVDYDKGAWYAQSNTSAPTVARPYNWLLKTRQEIMNFLAFLESHRGQHVPFYMPTWSKDIEILQDIAISDTGILIKNIGYTRYIKVHNNRKLLIFFPTNNSAPIVKTITGSSEGANNTEVLAIDSSFGVVKKASDFRAISFLTIGRFAQDDFEMIWHTDSIMQVSTHIKEIIQ